MLKKLVIGFFFVAVIVVGVTIFRRNRVTEGDQVEGSVRQARIERGELVVSVSATGSIVPHAEVNLTFDLPGKVEKVWVEVGDAVEAGDKLAQLNIHNLVFQVRQAEAVLAAAQAQLDQLKAGPRQEEVAVAEANLDAAEAGLDGAKANLRELKNGPDENQVAAAEANLRAAQASLWLTTIQRDQIADGASAAEIAAAKAQVASATAQQKVARDTHDKTMECHDVGDRVVCPGLGMMEEQARYNLHAADVALEAAQAQLNQLLAGPTEEQIDTGNANVAVAVAQRDATQAQLDLSHTGVSTEQLQAAQANVAALAAQRDAAQAQLDLLLAGVSVYQIAAAQANVDQAAVALEMAQTELDKATLSAPFGIVRKQLQSLDRFFPGKSTKLLTDRSFDWVVTAVNVREEEMAPVTLPAMTLADVSELQIVVDVDEIDVARIVEGQEVMVVVDALPDETIPGYIERIAPTASQVGGVIVYQVTIVLEDTDLSLRVGMSATAAIIIERLEDVLLVPNWAIRIDRDTGKTFVNLLREDTVEEIEIEIGVRGEDVSQVSSGLREGDVVAAGDVAGLQSLLDRGE